MADVSLYSHCPTVIITDKELFVQQDRIILHCDCNSFFASVETALNPSYSSVPMAVCGSTDDRHGIVLAKNELAKAYGIQTAETVYSAKKKCPSLVIAKPHREEYLKYSNAVNKIYRDYTDMVEPFGIDESWLDITRSQRLFGSGIEIAEQIKERVKKEIGITVSIGVSYNKVFAKLGSDYKKPDAITVISRENYKHIVFPLPVGDLLFVGNKTAVQLSSMGIHTIGELAASDVNFLSRKLGKQGQMLYTYANGLDSSVVMDNCNEDAKSVSNGLTFKRDLKSFDECQIGIDYLSDEIGRRLRNKNLKCNTVSITIKDEFLKVIQRQRPMQIPTDIACEISKVAFEILKDEWQEGRAVRMLTVCASGLETTGNITEQINLFDDDDSESTNREKNKKVEQTVDIIRQKHGDKSIIKGSFINNDIGLLD